MIPSGVEMSKINMQLESFKNTRGLFGIEPTIIARKKKQPQVCNFAISFENF